MEKLYKTISIKNHPISRLSDNIKQDYLKGVGAVLKKFAIDKGVESEDIFMDHAGFSTYESIYRAKEIFGAKKIVIVTQKYHLYRAIYIAKSLGVECYGIASDPRTYIGQTYRELREKEFSKIVSLAPEVL